MNKRYFFLIVALFLVSCSKKKEKQHWKTIFTTPTTLYSQKFISIPDPKPLAKKEYSWDREKPKFSPITKYSFCCQGNLLSDLKSEDYKNLPEELRDCAGKFSHSLPLKNHREFIYPCLIDLLNYLQRKFNEKVFINLGHVCPSHSAFAYKNSCHPKHFIGAAVVFHFEKIKLEACVQAIKDYYKNNYKTLEFINFIPTKEGEKNKEIALVVKENSIFIEVLYDKNNDTEVSVPTQEEAENYLRH